MAAHLTALPILRCLIAIDALILAVQQWPAQRQFVAQMELIRQMADMPGRDSEQQQESDAECAEEWMNCGYGVRTLRPSNRVLEAVRAAFYHNLAQPEHTSGWKDFSDQLHLEVRRSVRLMLHLPESFHMYDYDMSLNEFP